MVGKSSVRLDSRTRRVLRTASPSWVAADKITAKICFEQSWIYDTIYLDTKLILDVALFRRRGTDPTAAFLHGLAEKHDFSVAEFLVDGAGCLIALSRVESHGHLDYVNRTHIGKWFHTFKIRIDRFHGS